MSTQTNTKINSTKAEFRMLILVILCVIGAHVYKAYANKRGQERAIYSKTALMYIKS